MPYQTAASTDQQHSFTTAASPAQAWSILLRHARDEIKSLRLQELCSDVERVNSLVTVHSSTYKQQQQHHSHNKEFYDSREENERNNILLADFSRQKITLDTLNHLLRLFHSRDIKGFIQKLAWGQNDPENPITLINNGANNNPNTNSPNNNPNTGKRNSSTNSRRINQYQQQTTSPSHSLTSISSSKKALWPSMHLALRVPSNQNKVMLTFDGKNALDLIHDEWNKIERMSSIIRRKKLIDIKSSSHILKKADYKYNNPNSTVAIQNVVVIGRGVPIHALQFIYNALKNDFEAEKGSSCNYNNIVDNNNTNNSANNNTMNDNNNTTPFYTIEPTRKMIFLTSLDPVSISNGLSNLYPESTIVIFISFQQNDELGLTFEIVKNWMIHSLNKTSSSHRSSGTTTEIAKTILLDHLFLITTSNNNEKNSIIKKTIQNFQSNNIFIIPSYIKCEPFTTFTAATLFPLSIIFGWGICSQMIAGAHDMDTHFVTTNPRHNLPILFALIDLWNDAFLGTNGRIVTPFCTSFSMFPNFVSALESQTCGNRSLSSVDHKGNKINNGSSSSSNMNSSSATVLDGTLNGTYDRMLYQGGRIIPSELIIAMDTQSKSNAFGQIANHDALICSYFAHADVLAFGTNHHTKNKNIGSWRFSDTNTMNNSATAKHQQQSNNFDYNNYSDGNRPSTLLITGRCDAFTCGQLLALSEHRALVTARLWDVDPFVQRIGSSIRYDECDRLQEKLYNFFIQKDNDDGDDEDINNNDGSSKRESDKINFATSTILKHYANRMLEQRHLYKNN